MARIETSGIPPAPVEALKRIFVEYFKHSSLRTADTFFRQHDVVRRMGFGSDADRAKLLTHYFACKYLIKKIP